MGMSFYSPDATLLISPLPKSIFSLYSFSEFGLGHTSTIRPTLISICEMSGTCSSAGLAAAFLGCCYYLGFFSAGGFFSYTVVSCFFSSSCVAGAVLAVLLPPFFYSGTPSFLAAFLSLAYCNLASFFI